VAKAAQWGVSCLALADANNSSAAGAFVAACQAVSVKPILGISFWAEGQWLYTGLARNAAGWQILNQFLSRHTLEGKPIPKVPPPLPDTWIIYPRLVKPIDDFRDNELLGIRPEHVNRLFSHALRHRQEKLVVLCPVLGIHDADFEVHRLLRAIDLNTVHTKLTPRDVAKPNDRLLPPATLRQFYKAYPGILRNTQRVVDSCTADLSTGLSVNRKTFTGTKLGDFNLLEKLALQGCKSRYGKDAAALHRTTKELKIILEQDFCTYFLVTWDLVRYAHSTGYHHVGRGSGANSIVAYNLGISDVDPLELDLYFERFINPYRASPPDFDIDFSWDQRDDVLDYLYKRYGEEHTALLATYSTFQRRAALREIGKVYGLPKADIDLLVLAPQQLSDQKLVTRLQQLAQRLEGMPNHLSIHAGGVIISEAPLYAHTALQKMPKGFAVVQVDMHQAEALGFHKFDILSQRGLGHIKDAVELIRKNTGQQVNIHEVEAIKEDLRVKRQLKSGDCLGCFYVESPAMRGLLTKLRCDSYRQLVAASSIIRPGVAKSGMMKEYIRRFHRPHSFRYPHPVFEQHLGETFGIMVYQEDVMKIVHHFAGLDLDESDVLRRIMSGKKFAGDTFERLREKYFSNCATRGYSQKLAEEVWTQIESFSGYSFCKAHSASFAVESMQSLYLKTYYPREFLVAVINNFGGFYRTEIYVRALLKAEATVEVPCVNHSHFLTTIRGATVYLGLVHLRALEQQLAHHLVAERARGGDFSSLADFVNRVEVTADQLEILIRIGAFRFTGQSKYSLLWQRQAVLQERGQLGALSLFSEELPMFVTSPEASTEKAHPRINVEQAFAELELLGFPLCSPFELVDPTVIVGKDYGAVPARLLHQHLGELVHLLGYYVCQKSVRTVKNEHMAFGCWLDESGDFFDTVHFPDYLQAYPFRGNGVYRIQGRVTEEFGSYSVEVVHQERLPYRES